MLKYLKKYWFFALLAPIFMIGEVSMDLLQPELMSRIIDDGVLGLNNGGVGNLNTVITIGLKMIGFVALGGGLFPLNSDKFSLFCMVKGIFYNVLYCLYHPVMVTKQ